MSRYQKRAVIAGLFAAAMLQGCGAVHPLDGQPNPNGHGNFVANGEISPAYVEQNALNGKDRMGLLSDYFASVGEASQRIGMQPVYPEKGKYAGMAVWPNALWNGSQVISIVAQIHSTVGATSRDEWNVSNVRRAEFMRPGDLQ